MKNFSTWMLVIFMMMFWLFRLVVAFTSQLGMDFGGIAPINQTMEIALLFIVLVCMILIVKRKIIGALIYLLAYGMYFGTDLINGMMALSDQASIGSYANMLIALIGIIIPVAILFDLLLDKNRKTNAKDGKTDWFYQNEKFDRKMDERADKNNYKYS